MACLGREVQVSCSEFTVNLMGIDEIANLLHRLQAQLPQSLGGVTAHPFFDTGLIRTLTGTHMSAVAA